MGVDDGAATMMALTIKDNLNSTEARVERCRRQAGVENDEQNLYGQSLEARLSTIRERIFGGNDWRKNERQMGLDMTPNPTRAVEMYYPAYTRLINRLYGGLNQEANKDGIGFQNSVVNLAGLIYILGVAIHPYEDGNGQTLKVGMTSYIHEFLPATRDFFLPYKFGTYVEAVPGAVLLEVNEIPVDTTDLPEISQRYYSGIFEGRSAVTDPELINLEKNMLAGPNSLERDEYVRVQHLVSQRQMESLLDYALDGNNFEKIVAIVEGSETEEVLDIRQRILIESVARFRQVMTKDESWEDRETHTEALTKKLKQG